MPLIPLWSGIILTTVNPTSCVRTDSYASVENWLRIVKNTIFNSEIGIRAAYFIRSKYVNINNRTAAFKFAFTPCKVFEQKEN